MKSALALLTLLVVTTPAFSQDVKVREQAEHLLERANAVSSSPHLPNLERIDTFRAFEEGAVKEGAFTRVVVQGTGRRDEYTFGDYHLLNVWTQKQVAVVGSSRLLPPELVHVMRLTPINLVRFDGEDVIHTITEREVNGVAARCIGFDTVKGERADHNELCVDAANGTLLLDYSDLVYRLSCGSDFSIGGPPPVTTPEPAGLSWIGLALVGGMIVRRRFAA